MNLLAVGRSLLVGAGLGVLRTPAGRSDPLVFTPFEAALKAVDPQRLGRVQELAGGATVGASVSCSLPGNSRRPS